MKLKFSSLHSQNLSECLHLESINSFYTFCLYSRDLTYSFNLPHPYQVWDVVLSFCFQDKIFAHLTFPPPPCTLRIYVPSTHY